MFRKSIGAFGLCSLFLTAAVAFSQTPDESPRQLLVQSNQLKARLSAEMNRKKYQEAGKTVVELREIIKKLDASKQVSPAVLSRLIKFVDRQSERLAKASPAPDKPSSSPTTKPPAGTRGTVSFAKEIAPIFVRNCIRCHGGNNPRSGFNLTTFAGLIKGGDRGDDVVRGKPAESLMIALLKGDEEPRMPPGNRSLRRDLIQQIEKWIEEGAHFDGSPTFNPDSALRDMVPTANEIVLAKLAAMSDEQLVEHHKQLALRHWTLANAAVKPQLHETESFLVYGSVPKKQLEEAALIAQTTLRELQRTFARSGKKEQVWRGKFTLHLFSTHYQYAEHARMVERRRVPRDLHGHFFDLVETSYAAIEVPGTAATHSLTAQVAEQVAEGYLSTLYRQSPSWFRTGVARALASRRDPKAEIFQQYRRAIKNSMSDPETALNGLLDGRGELNRNSLAFGLSEFILSQRQGARALSSIAQQLDEKTPATEAFESALRTDKKRIAVAWRGFTLKNYSP